MWLWYDVTPCGNGHDVILCGNDHHVALYANGMMLPPMVMVINITTCGNGMMLSSEVMV